MKPEIASAVSARLLEARKQLNDALTLIQQNCEEEEAKRLLYSFGDALATISLEILDVIYKEHPELAPPGFY